jgi:hypothetical protein
MSSADPRQRSFSRFAPRFVGAAGAEGLGRLDRGGTAALAAFGLVEDGRRQGIAGFDVIFVPGDGGEDGH